MPVTHSSSRPPFEPLPTGAGLAAVVDAVDSALSATPPDGGALLRVTPADAARPDALDVGWLRLHGKHPFDALVGFVAPPEWLAIGVATTGRAHSLDGASRMTSPVRVVMLLDRSGASAGLLHHDGATQRLSGVPEGFVADACRRAFGLATAPPLGSTAGLWVACWLDHLLEAAAPGGGGGGRQPPPGGPLSAPPTWPGDDRQSPHRPPLSVSPTWAEVVARHPAAAVPPAPASWPAPPSDPAALAAATVSLADAWPWSRLRREPGVLEAVDSRAAVAPRAAAWMDDGLFARWVASCFPPSGELLDACEAVLPAAVAEQLRHVCEAVCPVMDDRDADADHGGPPAENIGRAL